MKEKTVFVGLRMPVSMRESIRRYAEKKELNESDIIRKAARAFLRGKSITKSNNEYSSK